MSCRDLNTVTQLHQGTWQFLFPSVRISTVCRLVLAKGAAG